MLEQPGLIYSYDGSFTGFLCCVFESFTKKELPGGILGPNEVQLTIFPAKSIDTDIKKARRVEQLISSRIGAPVLRFLRRAFLTCLPQKEVHMLRFVRLAYRKGPGVVSMLSDGTVYALHKAVRFLGSEVERYKGFVRFSDCGGVLVSTIQPKNYVLPFLGLHFRVRFPGEKFLIYDESHHMLCACSDGRFWVSDSTDIEQPEASGEEENYRRLWRAFYDAIAIKERENSRCRMGHMPKRYWHCMTEMQQDEAARRPAKKEGGPSGLLDMVKLR